MNIEPLDLTGVFSIEIERRTDERGFFARTFCVREFADKALETMWVQANTSFSSAKGTVRGMHFQRPSKAEVKLVRCVRGAALDVVVDIRAGSPTYGRWIGYELTAEARNAIYVPHGFAHGFQTLEADTELMYFVSEFYSPDDEGGLCYNDPLLAIDWPLPAANVSQRDLAHPSFAALQPVELD